MVSPAACRHGSSFGPRAEPFSFDPRMCIASWVNSLWLVATLVGAVALVHYVVIPREEQYRERRFGADYLDYMRSVRRWL
jgi:hypothetical protein